ncbi:hypothetical protein DNTS_013458 [Danionella cerebrum]|uniref:Uncharacterized protein n=1 Tax=Danionella cerebrum TaxID=2873325 RepID=A0A553MQ45_9TELE|nr:hypothetical protein DNTS_013458 [Danionella translucida]
MHPEEVGMETKSTKVQREESLRGEAGCSLVLGELLLEFRLICMKTGSSFSTQALTGEHRIHAHLQPTRLANQPLLRVSQRCLVTITFPHTQLMDSFSLPSVSISDWEVVRGGNSPCSHGPCKLHSSIAQLLDGNRTPACWPREELCLCREDFTQG